jgi:hypothetical protein
METERTDRVRHTEFDRETKKVASLLDGQLCSGCYKGVGCAGQKGKESGTADGVAWCNSRADDPHLLGVR